MKTPLEILESVREYAGIEDKRGKWGKLSDAIGYNLDSLYNFTKKGVRDKLSPDIISCIQDTYPQISKTYLKTGEGDILKLDTGISNYGHDARMQEMCSAIEQISNEDKELVYNLLMRLKKENDDLEDAIDKAFEK